MPSQEVDLDQKAAEQAIAWARRLAARNNGALPEWGAYKDQVKAYLNDPYNMPFKIPQDYQYAYFRVKGMSHADALERMGLQSGGGHRGRHDQRPKHKDRWWKFW